MQAYTGKVNGQTSESHFIIGTRKIVKYFLIKMTGTSVTLTPPPGPRNITYGLWAEPFLKGVLQKQIIS